MYNGIWDTLRQSSLDIVVVNILYHRHYWKRIKWLLCSDWNSSTSSGLLQSSVFYIHLLVICNNTWINDIEKKSHLSKIFWQLTSVKVSFCIFINLLFFSRALYMKIMIKNPHVRYKLVNNNEECSKKEQVTNYGNTDINSS